VAGSGKTTLLHNIVAAIAKNQTVAILQNETSAFMGVERH
jgi:G3E family GTPase